MPGQPLTILDGGLGGLPSMVSSPSTGAGLAASRAAQPHTGAIVLVIVAVAVLFALDKLGFRFAVTAGRA